MSRMPWTLLYSTIFPTCKLGFHVSSDSIALPTHKTITNAVTWVLRCLKPSARVFKSLFRLTSKRSSELHITGSLLGNPAVTGGFPIQRASNAEIVPLSWGHHVCMIAYCTLMMICFAGIISILISMFFPMILRKLSGIISVILDNQNVLWGWYYCFPWNLMMHEQLIYDKYAWLIEIGHSK